MQVRVLFFGQLKEIVGSAQDDAELAEGARVEDLFERYGQRFPKLAAFRPSIAASVNQEYADWRSPLAAGDEVAFFPPVSGGQQQATIQTIFSNWCATRFARRKSWTASRRPKMARWSTSTASCATVSRASPT